MWRESEGLIVHVSPVTNTQNIHGKGAVIDGINNAIVPYTDTPEVVGIRQFLAADWPWCCSQRFYLREDSLKDAIGQSLQLPTGRRPESDLELIHGAVGVS